LDEPTSGVDPEARRSFWEIIYALADAGTTVFVTTHYMDEAEHCARLGIMNAGRLLAMGSPTALKRTVIRSSAWDVVAEPPIEALDALQGAPGVLWAGLLGDHLHVLAQPAVAAEQLVATLAAAGVSATAVEPAEPTLEDVFTELARHR
jgi:ABC-2 type transport system ATP-binding protein